MAGSTLLMEYARKADETVRRWNTSLVVPPSADDARIGNLIRSAFIRAAQAASQFKAGPFYPDDHSWSYNGMRGVTRARIVEEMEIAKDNMAGSPEEWGIVGRVSCGDVFFDVPIALDLEPTAAENILQRMKGHEHRYVDIEALSQVFPGQSVSVQLHADNWGALRDIAKEGFLPMDVAMDFRRPVVWDLLRARMVELPPEPLTPFVSEEFYTRFARSSRYDASLMRSFQKMIEPMAKTEAPVNSIEWAEWQSSVSDMLNSIGVAQPMSGISIILNFIVEEPLAVPARDAQGEALDSWSAVGYHNLIVGYGLHPLTAIHVLELVRQEAIAFFELPTTPTRRYVLVGASAIQDTMLSALRVSTYGRTEAYDLMVESERPEPVEDVASPEDVDDDDDDVVVAPKPVSSVMIDDYDDNHFDV